MNIGSFSENILDSDLSILLDDWKTGHKFCSDIKVLVIDDPKDVEVVIFEGCDFKSLETIFLQCPYLALIMNDEGEFKHTGVDLDIEFLLTIIWIGD